jgi:predicted nucleic acid-binding protein
MVIYPGREKNSMSDDSAYQFLDTNVLVYAHDKSAGEKHEQAKTLIQELWNSGTGCLSIQVLQEFHVTITQKVAQPLSVESAARIIEDLAFWKVYAPQAKDVLRAIDLQQRYKLSFWDAMIVWSATQLACSIIWSEDLNPGQVYEGAQLLNPFK